MSQCCDILVLSVVSYWFTCKNGDVVSHIRKFISKFLVIPDKNSEKLKTYREFLCFFSGERVITDIIFNIIELVKKITGNYLGINFFKNIDVFANKTSLL